MNLKVASLLSFLRGIWQLDRLVGRMRAHLVGGAVGKRALRSSCRWAIGGLTFCLSVSLSFAGWLTDVATLHETSQVVRNHSPRIDVALTQAQNPATGTSTPDAAQVDNGLSSAPSSLQSAVQRALGSRAALSSTKAGMLASFTEQGTQLAVADWSVDVGPGIIQRDGILASDMSSKPFRTRRGAIYRRFDITESFARSGRGEEQSFSLATRMPGVGDLQITVPVAGLVPVGAGASVSLTRRGTTVACYCGLHVFDTGGRTIPATMHSNGSAIIIDVADGGARYPLTVDPVWTAEAQLVAPSGTAGEDMGYSVAISGTTALIGAPYHTVGNNSDQGAAYVFTESGTTWTYQTELTAPDGAANDSFGAYLDLSGSTAVISAWRHTPSGGATEQGAVYVFTGSGSSWGPPTELTASGSYRLGTAVALSGSTAVIGALYQNNGRGAAYVFTSNGSSWSAPVELSASDGGTNDYFGASVDVSGSLVVVGALQHVVSNAAEGAAYVFAQSGNSWTQQSELVDPGLAADDRAFGRSVAIDGSTLVVGASAQTVHGNVLQGAAFIFVQNGTTWAQVQELVAPDGAAYDQYGWSADLIDSTLIIGANEGGGGVGAAYVYSPAGSGWSGPAEITPPNGANGDVFGYSVAVSGTTAIVGAIGTVVNGTPQGATYVFGGPANGPIAYQSAVGLASGVTRHNSTCTSGTYPVNCASGDFWHTFTDISVPGRGPGLDLERSYNSIEAGTGGIFGYGWAFTYDEHLTSNADGSTTITEGDGAQVTATPNPGGSWSLPAWANSTLVQHADGSWAFVRAQVTTYDFDTLGRLTSITDPNGYATSLSYGSGGQLTTVTDAAGRSLTFSYGTNGLVASIGDPGGRTIQYAYDSSDNLTSVTDAMSRVTSFTYNSNHLLLTMTDPRGGIVRNAYDSSGRVTSQMDPVGLTTSYAYSGNNFGASGGTTTMTDPHGNVEMQRYVSGGLVSLTKGAGTASAATWTFSYDPGTLGETSVTDPDGNQTTATYDAEGNLLTSTDGVGNTTTATYNALDEPLSQTDPKGIVTTYSYDSNGNVLSKTVTGVGGSPVEATSYSYGDGHPGDLTKVIDPAGHEKDYSYDTYGDVSMATVSPSTSQTNTTAYVYDILGRKTCEASPNATASGIVCPASSQPPVSGTTSWTYDPDGDVTSVTDPLGHATSSVYDADGNVTQVTDPAGNVTETTYDLDNRKLSVTKGYGSSAASTTSYAYDLVPQATATASDPCLNSVSGATYCTASTDPLGNVTLDYHDALDRQMTEVQPTTGTTTRSYDLAGNLQVQITAGGTATYAYDADNRVTSISYAQPAGGFSAAPNVSYRYDADGQRTQMSDGTGTTQYSFDSLERLQSVTNGAGAVVGYGYDLDNEATCLSYPSAAAGSCQNSVPSGLGVVTRAYDGAGELKSITDWQGRTTTYSYDHDGNVQTNELANGITSTTTYLADDTIQSITDSPTSPGVSFSYTHNNDGQVQGETDTGVPAPSAQGYSYDQISRLSGDSTGPYSYNRAGNLTASSDGTALSSSPTSQELTSTASPITEVGTPATSSGAIGVTSAALPSGIEPSDQILVAVMELNTETASTPAGYSAVGTYGPSGSGSVRVQLFRKTAAGGESGISLSYAQGSIQGPTAVLAIAYRGVDAAQPLDGSSGGASTTSTVTAPSITTSLAGDQLVLFQAAAATSGSGFSAPSGMGESTSTSSTPVFGQLATGFLSTAGPSGDKTATWSGTATSLAAEMVALRPSVTTYHYDALGDRIGAIAPGRQSLSYGYDQLGRMVSYGSSATYAYNGDGVRTTKTTSGGGIESFTWDVSSSQPRLWSDNSTNYIYGPGDLPLEQIQTPNIRLVGTGTAAGSSAQSPLSVSLSATAQANDQLVVAVSEDPQESASISGYSLIGTYTGSEDRLQVFHKTASGGESSVSTSVSAPAGDVHGVTVSASVYRGVDPFNPIDSSNGAAGSPDSTSVTVPGVSASEPGDELLMLEGASTATSAPGVEGSFRASGMTEETQVTDTVLTSSAGLADLALGTNPPPSSVVVTVSALSTATSVNVAGLLVALKPVPPSYYLHDQLGSTRVLTDQRGNVVSSYTFSPYGAQQNSASSSNPFGFAGAYSDTESGLSYLVHRYYDPATGQFLSVDPAVSLTDEPYGYTSGDPVNRTDPLGLHWYDVFNPWSSSNPIRTGAENDPNGLGTTLVQNLDPAYLAVSGYANEWESARAGCSVWRTAEYGAEGVAGVGLTALTAVGAGEAAGFIENPDAWLQVGQRGFHIHYDNVPHGDIGSHLQVDTWLKGVSGSGRSWRMQWPPW